MTSRGGQEGSGRRTRGLLAIATATLAMTWTGCGLSGDHPDLVNGKEKFVSRCGACHTLARAGTKGVSGPSLDVAFARARADGMRPSTFEGIVHEQILHPSRLTATDPETGKALPNMPADLVTGKDAVDVAAYVAMAAAAGGKDTGRLASVGVAKSKGTAKVRNGVLSIPADPSGQLAYQYESAAANPGRIRVESKNEAPIDHDIAIEGNGVEAKGPVVRNGGTSRFTTTLEPGTYTFYCTVAGHREGGMEGKLTVR